MIKSRLLAHRWVTTLVLAAVLGLLGWITRSSGVSFPLVNDPVPARMLVSIGVTVVSLLPLYSSFPELEPTLVREVRIRVLRVVLGPGLAALAVAPGWLVASEDPRWRSNLVLFCLLVAAGILAVTTIGELAWSVPLSLGVLSLVLEGGPAQRVTRLLDSVPMLGAIAVVVLVAAVFVRWGPRRGSLGI